MEKIKVVLPAFFLASLFFLIELSMPDGPCIYAGHQTKKDAQEIVKIRAIPPEKPVSPGESFELTLELTVAAGFHLNSSKPDDEMLVPTSVELKKTPLMKSKK